MTHRTKIMIRTALLGGALFCGISFLLPGCKEKEEEGKLEVLSAVNAASPVMPEEDLELLYYSDFYFDRLEYEEQKIYINMLRACRDMKDKTYFDSVPEDTFLKADYAIFADHPEITWRWSYSGIYAGMVDTVYFDITDEKNKERNALARQKAQEILENMDPDLSDYDKMLYFYDRIIDDTEYAENEYDQDMTSVFVDHVSVCAGYSRAFQYLCREAGIECAYVEGIAYGFQEDDEEAHAWNQVKLDDDHYWIDVTWGDPLSEDEKYKKTYSYFCTDDEEFFRTHDPKANVWLSDGNGGILDDPLYSFTLPECPDDSRDYYKINGAYFENYDRVAVAEFIGKKLYSDPESVVEFKMGDAWGYEQASDELFEDRVYIYDIIEEWLGSSVAGNRDVYFIEDDNTFVISLFLG